MTKTKKNKMYGDLCVGWNENLGEYIRLKLKNSFLYKKNKELDELSFLDLRIQKAWNVIPLIKKIDCNLFIDEDLNIYSPDNEQLPDIPSSKIFKYQKKILNKYEWVFNLSKCKMIKSPVKLKQKSVDLNRILISNFLNKMKLIQSDYILNLAREARNVPNYLEMFDYPSKSFLDIKIINDLAIQFDLERQNSFRHFLFYCLNKSTLKEIIKYEIGLYYEFNSIGWGFYKQQLSSRNNIGKNTLD